MSRQSPRLDLTQPRHGQGLDLLQIRLNLEWSLRRMGIALDAHRNTVARWELGVHAVPDDVMYCYQVLGS